ncbi:hypothetical protein P153DRAFT_371602 [Dothidotthia symphoricarpi CBS 119687]|uniref:Protein Zds1 C-terminal domain-containing protein n=1 Tax=Dothidotthia symphoricarpi CBS 119687 TaxID=1392245 RepID=A0A6A5ZW75_9PLEO|nr:uncharacterized protein P153DRAFT_371602 [Dothidotthia symphoricarpi CBS 119687]KAF2123546.1 hypothetical protein P153DRAFT_371602 [Dothidotthia symphoricarpi CBS 119687]
MATPTDRARELERMYQLRRGHAPRISISDDSHHVTEAIGDMYGSGDSDADMAARRNSRPLSFLPDPFGDAIQSFDPFPTAPPARSPLRPQLSSDNLLSPTAHNGSMHMNMNMNMNMNTGMSAPQDRAPPAHNGPNGVKTPPLSRTSSDTASQQFPLNDIDYESSPAGLAQELSNLQAIRRMSMGMGGADPDLPSFQSGGTPAISPPHFSEEDDPSALFWVPARLHPELAPVEFKTFIEDKIDKTRRRSGDAESMLSPDGPPGRQGSVGGLRRKKSMLSRQVDNGVGYKDGAERLERTRSGRQVSGGLGDVQELEHIIEDPTSLVRRMSMSASESETGPDGDTPILPGKVGPGFLKRSTRTTYRRGSLRKGGPALSRRLITRQVETDTEESPSTSPTHSDGIPDVPRLPLNRVQSEPVNSAFESPSNFSRPSHKKLPKGDEDRPGSAEEYGRPGSSERGSDERPRSDDRPRPQPKAFHSRIASNGRTTAPLPGYVPPQLPQIIATPPPQELDRRSPLPLPERLSSRQPPPQQPLQPLPPPQQQQQPQPQPQPQPQQQPNGPRQPRPLAHPQPHTPPQPRQSPSRPNRHAQAAQASPISPAQSFDDVVQRPSPIPGQSNARADNLSIVPNLPEEKKSDPKAKVKKDDGNARKTSWGWLVGGNQDKERDKKEKDDKDKEVAKKVKNKLTKPQEKSHDDTRLDLLQTSIQRGNGSRESVILDREGVKLEEERKKESSRKTSSDIKKEKEPGLLSSIFGGGKKKSSEKELAPKKHTSRGLSPEPPPRILKPDIDYNWTRFSILEERAIYRMAHIKLANPRRELYSQVLLSNFMYSYLAKVQQMHPQIQIGNSKQAKQAQQQQQAAQQRKEQKQQQQPQPQPQPQLQPQPQQQQQHQQPQQQQQQAQPEEFAQYQRYQQQQQQQSQPQPEQSNEWPSVVPKQNDNQANPRDSHHSHHSSSGSNGSNGTTAKGYSVAGTQNYLGQAGSLGGRTGEVAAGKERDDDMW